MTRRPITEAADVVAVWYEDWGMTSDGSISLILAAWPDGYVVWSEDPLYGGPPYFAAQRDGRKVMELLARFERDGLLDMPELERGHWGPGADFNAVLLRRGGRQLKMGSWHELGEARGGVCTSRGRTSAGGRRRLEWLVRETGQPVAGGPVTLPGELICEE